MWDDARYRGIKDYGFQFVNRPITVVVPQVKPVRKKEPKPFQRTDAMTATATAIDNFEKTVKQHTAKKIGDAKVILEQIVAIKTANPPVYEEDKIKVFLTQRAKALNVLIDNYLVARLSTEFPMLDNGIFNLKRHIYIKNGIVVDDSTAVVKAQAVHVEFPLFMHAEMDSNKRLEISKYKQRSGDYLSGFEQKTTTITAAVPFAPLEVAELGRKALGYFHSFLAELYNNPATSDLVFAEQPTLETMWIPTVSSLNIKVDVENIPAPKTYDPALLLKHRNRYYLVSMWDIKEELPFENILREFSVGPAQFPKKN